MLTSSRKQYIVAALAAVIVGGAADAEPVWREAFQSSPATYEAPSEEFIKFATERWGMQPEKLRADLKPQPIDGTVRYRITVQAAGSQIRIRLSNEEGLTPLQLNFASVGLAADAFTARTGSLQPLTFGGVSSVSIPAGAPWISDPVRLTVQAGTELIVSVALASPMQNEGRGGAGFVLAEGDQTLKPTLERATPMKGRPLVAGISVLTEPASNVVVTLGDSITDGNRAEPGTLQGWPEQLARRLSMRKSGQKYIVVNAGIAGNRVLAPGWGAAALARLDRDALRIDGISHLILLEGVNDINFSGKSAFGSNPDITADELINGYRQIIERARSRGVKVYLGTLTPNPASEITTAPKVAIRDAVNHWIRTSGEADAVIDFDAMVRDPAAPTQFRLEFDSGDHLHPSELGHKAMGNGIDLSLFPRT